MDIFITYLTSFVLTLCMTPLVIRLATACNCLDTPGGRRLHTRITPLWGGVAIVTGVLPFLIIENGSGALTAYIAASLLLAGMGMIDDRISLGWLPKISVMAVSTTMVVFGGDTVIHQIGIYGSFGRVELGWLSIPFTYLSILGITNAINLLDGLDGLAGGVSLLAFLFMGIAAFLAGNIPLTLLCFSFVGALTAFLLFNFPKARIFMGDTGSLFLGFSLACTAVMLTQHTTSSVNVLFPALVLLIPIFDTLRVLLVRLLNGKNPFIADSTHLHYLLVHKNIAPTDVTLLFWLLTTFLGTVALTLINATTLTYLTVTLCATSALGIFAFSQTRTIPSGARVSSSSLSTIPSTGMETGSAVQERGTLGASSGAETTAIQWMVILAVVLLPVN